jgi:hypothetical protein
MTAETNTADVTDDKPIAVIAVLRCNAVNPLVAFYDIRTGKKEVLFFISVLDTTRDT